MGIHRERGERERKRVARGFLALIITLFLRVAAEKQKRWDEGVREKTLPRERTGMRGNTNHIFYKSSCLATASLVTRGRAGGRRSSSPWRHQSRAAF